ncbi:hypothetical protein AAY84_12230 [Serratia marcescens]|uniref:hypothetical protein n=1 Tax=Serratia marcescens TaxID=615 RepID=UPI00062CA5BD|nr:hypothetical protein [Serratia marcescens]KKZ18113.1 hypothetical protein AAY84_12230 [Serratia marcescens]
MENKFDFELEGKDDLSGTIKNLEEVVKKMLPALDQADKKLKLGGQETVDGLDKIGGKLSQMSAFAKSGVQYFGDMVPPLKMVGGLADRYGGILARMGGVGVAAYGAVQGVRALASGLSDAGQEAYNLGVQSKNSGMSVHDLTQVAGAMEILGSDTDTARQSVVDLSRSLTDALNDRNKAVLSAMQLVHAPIFSRPDGTADTMKTLEELARIYPTLSPQNQKTVSDALGLNDQTLALLREGAHYKELLAKSDKFGLTISSDQIQQLQEINAQENELLARLDGYKQQFKLGAYNWLLGGTELDSMNAVKESKKYDKDDKGNFYHGNQQEDIIHRARRDEEFKKTLTFGEGLELALGHPGKALQEKLEKRYLASWKAQSLKSDLNEVVTNALPKIPPLNNHMYGQPKKNTLGIRNNNPGNLRHAPNASGYTYTKDGVLVQFKTPEDGLSALSRQLMLYGDRNKNTLNDILPTFAPKGENNTKAYIDDVAKKTGLSPTEPLDLHSPEVLARIMPAIINHENGTQPFTYQQIEQSIQDSIVDPRWSGKRDQQQLLMQRQKYAHEQPPQVNALPQSSSIIVQNSNQELVSVLSQAMQQAQREGKSQVELVITNGSTGEKRVVTLPPGGKVTTSMSPP